MYDFQDYCWELVEEAARQSACRLPFDERCSAAALGLAYGMRTYTWTDGNQMTYLQNCMAEAIRETSRKLNRCKRIESDYSLDKAFCTDNGSITGHDFIPHPMREPENAVIFRDFLNHLSDQEREAAYALMHGSSKLEFMLRSDITPSCMEHILAALRLKLRTITVCRHDERGK